ncbi:MAG: D-hexose-6-phosphate mutarotase, partial [Cellvibrionales bacterium]|nr:D-hexose-6-phosphate mutarotase [Cellvibrionales bacterium]
NPGLEKAAELQDMGAENYQQFVCVERGNVFDNEVMLLPNETHRASLHIQL